jgi:ribosomal protein L35
MPKMKSKSSVTKRFRTTKTGKLKSARPQRGHMRANKNSAFRRKKRTALVTTGAWAKLLVRMMGSK